MVLLKSVCHESWPLAAAFSISRGTKTSAEVVVVELVEGDFRGRGECVPYPRYGESIESVVAQIESVRNDLSNGMDRIALQDVMPAGAARCALDGAFWDLEAKRSGRRAWQLAGGAEPGTVTTVYTISLDTPEKMGASAKANAARPLMKLKLTGEGDLDRVAAVRQNAPNTELVVDANEGWSPDMVEPFSAELAALGVTSDDHIVAYDGKGIFSAPRLWWCLRAFGHDRASVLDGGLPAWVGEGHAVDEGPPPDSDIHVAS